jgi:hypothetical protein
MFAVGWLHQAGHVLLLLLLSFIHSSSSSTVSSSLFGGPLFILLLCWTSLIEPRGIRDYKFIQQQKDNIFTLPSFLISLPSFIFGRPLKKGLTMAYECLSFVTCHLLLYAICHCATYIVLLVVSKSKNKNKYNYLNTRSSFYIITRLKA